MSKEKEKFMQAAVDEAIKGMDNNDGGPFGCVIVKEGEIIGKGHNEVTSSNDPTAHAEVVAIRNACKNLNSFQLEDCEIYTTCEPCPMCLGAIYWARPAKVFFGSDKADAAKAGFDDAFIYDELPLPFSKRRIPFEQIEREATLKTFKYWDLKEDKIQY
jgi:tRNA(Arg) A34 adenosine deaminase TadA